MLKQIVLLVILATTLTAHADSGFKPVPADTNLYDLYHAETQGRSVPAETVAQQNAAVFAQLQAWKARPLANRSDAIDYAQANEILQSAMKNYVIGKEPTKGYDPQGNIGFCFGRAMWMHLELLKRGVNKDSVFKAYVVGDMLYDQIQWQFHVATVVRNKDGGFYVLDPEFMAVMTLEQWFAHNMTFSADKKLRLYVTEPTKFGASAARYDQWSLNDPWYNSYFKDMLGYFRDQANRIGKTELGVPAGAGPAAVAGVAAPVCREIFTSI